MILYGMRALWRAAIAGVFVMAAGMASAQTPAPYAYWQNSAGVVLAPLGGPIPDWRVVVGAGAAIQPLYEGSSRYRVTPAPSIDVRYKDIAFLSTGDGLGVNLLRGQTYRGGVALGYDVGRWQHLSGRLNGLGSVDAAPEVKLFAEYAILPFVVSANVRRAVGGANGYIGDLGIYMPVVGSEELVVFVGPSLAFADDRYMEAYFGVNPAQARPHSRFPLYEAHAGIKNASFGIAAVYNIDDHWLLDADLGIERLLGSAADSPIVEQDLQIGVSLVLAYKF